MLRESELNVWFSAGNMAQTMKHLLYKREKLRLIPRSHTSMLAWQCMSVVPALGRERKEDSGACWPVSLA